METYLTHEDTRVAAVLHLAHLTAEYPALDLDAHAVVAVRAILPHVPAGQARSVFNAIAADLHDALDMDTRGGEAVTDLLGGWSGTDPLTADEKASQLRDVYRGNAVSNAEMLVTLDDNLA